MFFDTYLYVKGEREERITLMKRQSELFSRFLSLHIGTERIVKLCQCFAISKTLIRQILETKYVLYKLQMQLLTTESVDNLLSGKTLLASWLYQQGKYTKVYQ